MSKANPWDIATISAVGEENEIPIYLAVGMALSSWEATEQALARIFGTLVNSRHFSAEAAFGLATSSGARLEMLLAAAERMLIWEADLLARLKAETVRVRNLAARRNDIAHGMVTGYSTQGEEGVTEHGCFLVPPSYATRKWSHPFGITVGDHTQLKYAYTAEQIHCYIAQFDAVRHELFSIELDCQKWSLSQWPNSLLATEIPVRESDT